LVSIAGASVERRVGTRVATRPQSLERVGDDALMNRYATNRVWPLYAFFAVGLLACGYVVVVQGLGALHGQIRSVIAVSCVLLAIPFLIAGVVFVRRYSRTE
jgi:hypothetical protein